VAIRRIRIGLTHEFTEVDPDAVKIDDVQGMVHDYLSVTYRHWFYISLGRSLYKNCCRSWSAIYPLLVNYQSNPKDYYSPLMSTLEDEIAKFPKITFYSKQLSLLKASIIHTPSTPPSTQFDKE